jgi:hypothetical protein
MRRAGRRRCLHPAKSRSLTRKQRGFGMTSLGRRRGEERGWPRRSIRGAKGALPDLVPEKLGAERDRRQTGATFGNAERKAEREKKEAGPVEAFGAQRARFPTWSPRSSGRSGTGTRPGLHWGMRRGKRRGRGMSVDLKDQRYIGECSKKRRGAIGNRSRPSPWGGRVSVRGPRTASAHTRMLIRATTSSGSRTKLSAYSIRAGWDRCRCPGRSRRLRC